VLGHSTGGMTATRFTLMNPEPVRNGAGFRFELSYTVTDLRTLQ
jgi:hypothetical protein